MYYQLHKAKVFYSLGFDFAVRLGGKQYILRKFRIQIQPLCNSGGARPAEALGAEAKNACVFEETQVVQDT